jgi:hypothetical protein
VCVIHLSVVGHLGCFHSLAIVNSAAINISVQVSLLYPEYYYIPLDVCPGAVSLDHMAVLCLLFWGISTLLSIMVVLICNPSNSVLESLFYYILVMRKMALNIYLISCIYHEKNSRKTQWFSKSNRKVN